ncbi:MAG: serine/threonine protein kinase [Bryobacterales bacterium]|nr:serine/threonine protein kinase [Bryobacterales bacterium]
MNVDELCMGCMSQRGASDACPHCGYVEGTPTASLLHLPPRTLLHGQYVIGRVLGHGGFGITYIGWDTLLERKLAVKEYFPAGIAMRTSGAASVSHYSGTQQKDYDYGLERYLEEARLLARFSSHPNILSVLNFFKENGTAYIVTEFLEGHTFQKHLEIAGERIGFEETMQVMLPVLRALEDVHAAGILHRDISPDNIHIGPNRQVKLLDFGAARIALGERSKNLSVILKEGYAPPEQYHSRGNQGPWTDIYASAATIYRAITGHHVPPALDRMAEDDLKPPISVGVAMSLREEEALLRALSFNTIDRFQTVREFHDALTLRDPLIPTASMPSVPPARITATQIEVPTVRASSTGSMAIPATAAPKAKVPAWIWSVLGGIVVLAVLFALRPKAQQPVPDQPAPQAGLQIPSPAPSPVPPPTAAPTPAPVTPAPTEAPTAAPQANPTPQPTPTPKPAAPSYAELIERARQPELSAIDQMTTLEQAIQTNPKLPEAYDLLAQNLLYKQNKPSEAEAQYRKAIEVGGYATFQVVLMQRPAMGGEVRPGKLSIGKSESTFVDNQGMRSYTTRNDLIEDVLTLREALPRMKLKTKMLMNQAGFQIKYRSGMFYNFLCTSASRDAERDIIVRTLKHK